MKRQPSGGLGQKASGREDSTCKDPEAGMSLACAKDKKKAMWLELSGERGHR